jgi:hypothetical protein
MALQPILLFNGPIKPVADNEMGMDGHKPAAEEQKQEEQGYLKGSSDLEGMKKPFHIREWR